MCDVMWTMCSTVKATETHHKGWESVDIKPLAHQKGWPHRKSRGCSELRSLQANGFRFALDTLLASCVVIVKWSSGEHCRKPTSVSKWTEGRVQ